RVAKLEAQHGCFREQAVIDAETRLVLADVVQRHVGLAGPAVVEDRVAVTEGAAAAVLTAETDVLALQQQRAERPGLGSGPVDGLALLEILPARAELALDLGVDREPLGDMGDGPHDALQFLPGNTGVNRFGHKLRLEPLPGAGMAAHPLVARRGRL